ncbi:MAG: hypothetical protein LAO79_11930, partial [Acidobacteriia bacterium]|nr:hypothetical protein [Terriglobia bacterium]
MPEPMQVREWAPGRAQARAAAEERSAEQVPAGLAEEAAAVVPAAEAARLARLGPAARRDM